MPPFVIFSILATASSATKMVRKLGRVVLLGDSPTPSKQRLGPRVVGNSVAILGMHGFMYPEIATPWNMWTAENMTLLFFDYVLSGRMNVKSLITHRRVPSDAKEIYHELVKKGDSVLGIAVDWKEISE